jgi:hypothetical protein
MKKTIARFISSTLIASMLSLSIWLPGAQAAMITSEQVISNQVANQNREKVRAFFDREDVRTQLQAQGVTADAAKARVDALTDNEVASMAGQIDNLPAGGTDILGFILLVFIILLFTDILGLTHVFPFTSHRR